MGRRYQNLPCGTTVAAGAVLEKIHARHDNIRATHIPHKDARPPAPEWGVGCGAWLKGGDSNVSEVQKELEYLRLEVAAGRSVVSRAGEPCARVSNPFSKSEMLSSNASISS